jgi:hypothetical protein
MTKRHFQAIASLLSNANLSVVDEDGNPQAADIVMADLCHDMADYFDSINALFNREIFLTACGL